jgi:hypothetical protein
MGTYCIALLPNLLGQKAKHWFKFFCCIQIGYNKYQGGLHYVEKEDWRAALGEQGV